MVGFLFTLLFGLEAKISASHGLGTKILASAS